MDTSRRTYISLAVIVGLLVLVIVAQSVAASIAPSGSSAQTGRLIGRAGFAYLSGIRTFAAAVLWNRLEPQFDLYYANTRLKDNVQLMPTIRLVQMLDPQFVQAYYNASWILWERGDVSQAFSLARDGIRDNPRAGLLRASYAQLLLSEDERNKNDTHLAEAVKQADAGTRSDMFWASESDKFEGFAVFSAVYNVAKMNTKAAATKAVVESLRASAGSASIGGAGHDHNGDGVPDH
jgi:hypothetical protein